MRLSGIYWRRGTGYSHFRVGFVPQAGPAVVCVHVQLCVHAGDVAWCDQPPIRRHGLTTSRPPLLIFQFLPSFLPPFPLLSFSYSFVIWGMEKMILPEEWECVWVCVMLTVVVSSVVS